MLAVSIVGLVSLSHAPSLYSSSVSFFYCERPTLTAVYWDSTWASRLNIAPGSDFHAIMMEQGHGIWPLNREQRVSDVAALRALGVAFPQAIVTHVSQSKDTLTQTRVGIPFRCFSGDLFAPLGTPTRSATHRFLVTIPPNNVHGWVHIPLRPLPGLAYSWFFWAALAYLPLSGFSLLRIRRRLKRGWCPRCAYDLAGVPRCPECGTVVVSPQTPDPGAVV